MHHIRYPLSIRLDGSQGFDFVTCGRVTLRQMLIDLGTTRLPPDLFFTEITDMSGGCAGKQGGWWDLGTFLDEGQRADDRVLPHHDIIHQDGVDADQCIPANTTSMQDGA